jgi:hypothetical protein
VRAFNLMFKTSVGATAVGNDVYLRPETAQGIFVNFQQVYNSMRRRLPFGNAPHMHASPRMHQRSRRVCVCVCDQLS